MASGGRYGFAQSLFQVGGSTGSAIGPLLAAFIVVPRGQGSVAWFSAAALLAIFLLTNVSLWYSRHLTPRGAAAGQRAGAAHAVLSRRRVLFAIAVLVALLFSKNVYTASPQLVLHVLPDPQVRALGAARRSICSCSWARSRPARSPAVRSATGSDASR